MKADMFCPLTLAHSSPIFFNTQSSAKVTVIIYLGTLCVLYCTEVMIFGRSKLKLLSYGFSEVLSFSSVNHFLIKLGYFQRHVFLE